MSYAGSVQYIKSVVFGIQIYKAQIFVLSKKILKLIEGISRFILWTGAATLSRKALVSWGMICYPRAAGGAQHPESFLVEQCYYLKQIWSVVQVGV